VINHKQAQSARSKEEVLQDKYFVTNKEMAKRFAGSMIGTVREQS